jgi:hypothetical protein
MTKKNEPREYRFIDPDKIDTSKVGPIKGTYAQCLGDALMDIIQLSLDSGMSDEDVDKALRFVHEQRASGRRAAFTLHVKGKE